MMLNQANQRFEDHKEAHKANEINAQPGNIENRYRLVSVERRFVPIGHFMDLAKFVAHKPSNNSIVA